MTDTDTKIKDIDADGTYESVKTDLPFERTALLLGIVEKVSTVAPGYMAIVGIAMSELKEINDEARKIAIKRGEEEKRRQAEIDAERQASVNRANEEEAARVKEVEERTNREVLKPGRTVEAPVIQPKVLAAEPTTERKV